MLNYNCYKNPESRVNNEARKIIIKHYKKKAVETQKRGYYSEKDIRKLLGVIKMELDNDNIHKLQRDLYICSQMISKDILEGGGKKGFNKKLFKKKLKRLNKRSKTPGKKGFVNYLVRVATFKEGILDFFQLLLDIVGLVPVLGAPADIANAVISILRGDFKSAFFSIIATIPVLGDILGAPLKYYYKYQRYKAKLDIVISAVN